MKNEILERVREGAGRSFEGGPVLFAYLFGSHAAGKTHPRSDIDLAVYVDDSVPADRYLDLRLELAGRLERAAGLSDVEVIILNEAPLRLAGRVLRDRQVVFSRDEVARVRYESLTNRLFLDFQIHAEALDRQLLRAIADGRR